MRLQMCGVDHNLLGFWTVVCRSSENTVKYTQTAPPDEPFIERFVSSIFLWCIFSFQAASDHIDDTADNTPVVETRNAIRQRKERRDAGHLLFAQ